MCIVDRECCGPVKSKVARWVRHLGRTVTYRIWSKTLEERDQLKYLGVVELAILK
jgi:hypothetical protein